MTTVQPGQAGQLLPIGVIQILHDSDSQVNYLPWFLKLMQGKSFEPSGIDVPQVERICRLVSAAPYLQAGGQHRLSLTQALGEIIGHIEIWQAMTF